MPTPVFGFYLDANLVRPVICPIGTGCQFSFGLGAAVIGFVIDINSLDSIALEQDVQVWFGSPVDTGQSVRDGSNPGVTSISVSGINVTNLVANPITRLKLASTQAGLDSATPGAALPIGVRVQSGVANAKTFWVRYSVLDTDPEFGCAETIYTNLVLETQSLVYTTP